MIHNGKYYIACGENTAVQISRQEHERLRRLQGATLIKGPANLTYVDDPRLPEEGLISEEGLWQLLDDVSAALETYLAHYGHTMPAEDYQQRNRLCQTARVLCDQKLRPPAAMAEAAANKNPLQWLLGHGYRVALRYPGNPDYPPGLEQRMATYTGQFIVFDPDDDADGFCLVGDDPWQLVRDAVIHLSEGEE